MKLFVVLFAPAAYTMAEAGPNLEARAGCSQKGQFCNAGTFWCCPGQSILELILTDKVLFK